MAVACMICMSSKMSDHKSLSEGSEIGCLESENQIFEFKNREF